MKAILLSAGLGTRLRPLTNSLAKPALPFLNIPMAGFPLYYLESLGLDRLVVNLHHLPETVMKAVSELTLNQPYELIFSHEQPTILDSGGGIAQVRTNLEGDGAFLIANADSILLLNHQNGLKPLLETHRQTEALATIVTCPMEGVGSRFGGVLIDNAGHVKGFSKTPPTDKGVKAQHYAGFIVVSDRIFKFLPQKPHNIFYDALTSAIAQGELVVAHHEDQALWFESGDAESFLEATRECLQVLMSQDETPQKTGLKALLKRYKPQWRLDDPTAPIERLRATGGLLYLNGPVLMDAGVELDINTQVEDFAVIGKGSKIDFGCFIKGSVIGINQHLKSGTHLNQSIQI